VTAGPTRHGAPGTMMLQPGGDEPCAQESYAAAGRCRPSVSPCWRPLRDAAELIQAGGEERAAQPRTPGYSAAGASAAGTRREQQTVDRALGRLRAQQGMLEAATARLHGGVVRPHGDGRAKLRPVEEGLGHRAGEMGAPVVVAGRRDGNKAPTATSLARAVGRRDEPEWGLASCALGMSAVPVYWRR